MEANGNNGGDAIRAHTPPEVQQRLDSALEERIRFYAVQPKDVIERRLGELDEEWDLDRLMITNVAGLALGGVVFSFLGGGRKWLLLSGAALGYLLMHGLQGWCPASAALRRFSIRSRTEIDAERYALKLLRGDFESVHPEESKSQHYPAENVWQAVRS